MSDAIRVISYVGPASHYLLVLRGKSTSQGEAQLRVSDNPNIVASFLVSRGDTIAVTKEVYELLEKQGQIGPDKVQDTSHFKQSTQIV